MQVRVFGSINMDVVAYAVRHPGPGETLTGRALRYFPGGKGANQAVAAAKLGARCAMEGAVGADAFGDTLVDFLLSSGVDVAAVKRIDGESTGVAVITVSDTGENTIVIVPGANLKARASRNLPTDQEGILALAQFETDVGETTQYFSMVRRQGGITILNPSPFGPVEEELIRHSEYLVVNEHEFSELTGADVHDKSAVIAALDTLPSHFNNVLVTLGPDGFVLKQGGRISSERGHSVEVVDTTGAGDCFTGAFAAFLAQGMPPGEAARRANAAAAISVTRLGAGASMPSPDEVARLLAG